MKVASQTYRTFRKIVFSLNLDAFFRMLKRGYIVLMYHSVPLRASWTYDVSKRCFEEHLRYLKNNYEILSISSIVDDIREKRDCQAPICGITFDDGYKNNYEIAYPLLMKYEIPATIFISTGCISNGQDDNYKFTIKKRFAGKRMLNWSEVKEMKESGLIDIGAHTHNHEDLTSLSKQDALREIRTSKKIIEDKLDTKIELFSFPGGKFNEDVKELVKSSGFKAGFTSEALINLPNQNPYEVSRISIGRATEELPYFVFKVCGLTDTLTRLKHLCRFQKGGRCRKTNKKKRTTFP